MYVCRNPLVLTENLKWYVLSGGKFSEGWTKDQVLSTTTKMLKKWAITLVHRR